MHFRSSTFKRFTYDKVSIATFSLTSVPFCSLVWVCSKRTPKIFGFASKKSLLKTNQFLYFLIWWILPNKFWNVGWFLYIFTFQSRNRNGSLSQWLTFGQLPSWKRFTQSKGPLNFELPVPFQFLFHSFRISSIKNTYEEKLKPFFSFSKNRKNFFVRMKANNHLIFSNFKVSSEEKVSIGFFFGVHLNGS